MTTREMSNHRVGIERQPNSKLVQIARLVYLVLGVLFVAGVVLQVFFAGATLLTSSEYLNLHRSFGDALARIPVFMVVASLLARLPTRSVLLSVLLFILFTMQFIFVHAIPAMGLPTAFRALHAVNALALFWTALHLVKSTWRIVRPEA
jgi:hypothetical protein